MARIVIVVEGGIVQAVLANEETEVITCDYDIDGAEEEELMETPYGEKGAHGKHKAQVEKGLVAAWYSRFNQWEEEQTDEKNQD